MPTSLRKLCKKELSLFVHYPTTYKWCHGVIYTALLQNVCIKQYKDNRLSIVRKYLQLKTGLWKIKGMLNDKIVLSKPKSIMLSSHYLMSKLWLPRGYLGEQQFKKQNDQALQSSGQRQNFILLSIWVLEHSSVLIFK